MEYLCTYATGACRIIAFPPNMGNAMGVRFAALGELSFRKLEARLDLV